MKKFIVAIVYTGKSKMLVPSRWYKVEASTKAVAASRALAKAQADNPRYSSYSATVDTLSARKIKRFNREFSAIQHDVDEWGNLADYLDRVADVNKRACDFDKMRRAIVERDYYLNELATFENHWLQMLELRDVING